MMIASPTAASAAATVMTNTTNTWPAIPYTRERATKVRFTALSISSTHMNRMIAFRRVSTPTTPMVKRMALKKSDSANTGSSSSSTLAQHHRAHHGGEQQHAGDFEGEQVLVEQRAGDRRDGAAGRDVPRDRILRQRERFRH